MTSSLVTTNICTSAHTQMYIFSLLYPLTAAHVYMCSGWPLEIQEPIPGGNCFSLSQHQLTAYSSLSKEGPYGISPVHTGMSTSIVIMPVLPRGHTVEIHGCVFHVISKEHNLSAGVLGLMALKTSIPLFCDFSLSFTYRSYTTDY